MNVSPRERKKQRNFLFKSFFHNGIFFTTISGRTNQGQVHLSTTCTYILKMPEYFWDTEYRRNSWRPFEFRIKNVSINEENPYQAD